jgi:hypothetical protein
VWPPTTFGTSPYKKLEKIRYLPLENDVLPYLPLRILTCFICHQIYLSSHLYLYCPLRVLTEISGM